MKLNNKVLGIIFISLLAVFIVRQFITQPETRSFKEVLVAIDTSIVDKIILSKGSAAPVELTKTSSSWTVSSEGKTAKATLNSVHSILTEIEKIIPLQLVSKGDETWKDYELEESAAKKIEIYSNNKYLDGFYAGRFNFNQNTRSAKTYIRKANENDVYAVNGFLSMTLDRSFDDFRNKKLFNGLSEEEIKGITLTANQEEQSLSFNNGQWLDQANSIIDSVEVEKFISSLITKAGTEIDDDFVPDQNILFANLELFSVENVSLASLKIYKSADQELPFVFHSSMNNDTYFRSDSSGLYLDIYQKFHSLLSE